MKKSEMRDLNKGLDDKNYDTKDNTVLIRLIFV
jgi:hypothetical protein